VSKQLEKRRLERGHFQVFRRLLANFPIGEVFHEDKPDFRVALGAETLGIEHTQLFHPADPGSLPSRATEAAHAGILRIAQEHAELQSMPGANVVVYFQPNRPIPKPRRRELGYEIARICMAYLPDPHSQIELSGRTPGGARLPTGVSEILLFRGDPENRHHWTSDGFGMVLEDSRELLQDTIDRKGELLPSYLKETSQCWLLMVADGISPSTFIEANSETQAHQFSSHFERTFFLTFGPEAVLELQTR
jgi:hypothetical protein